MQERDGGYDQDAECEESRRSPEGHDDAAFLRGNARPLDRGTSPESADQTAISCSRKTLSSDVLRSVEALRSPMTSAQGTPNVPAGNTLGSVPGMTTERGSMRPLVIFGSSPRTSTIGVLAVSTTPAPSTASCPTKT